MAEEDSFVEIALAAARKVVREPLIVKRGQKLLYQITVNNLLEITVNPKAPVRGQSAFETDLCVLERKNQEV
ncbi:MAG: hypothetical protein IT427_09960, partial [Pirellulales bacterium]|nr:hypothetical protein [Pirellulales bacterium]